jgi:hypothetical protein
LKHAYLGGNVIDSLKQKIAQTVTITLACFIFSKNHHVPSKVAQFGEKLLNLVTLLVKLNKLNN